MPRPSLFKGVKIKLLCCVCLATQLRLIERKSDLTGKRCKHILVGLVLVSLERLNCANLEHNASILQQQPQSRQQRLPQLD